MKNLSLAQKTEIAIKKHKEAILVLQTENIFSYKLAEILFEIKKNKLYRYAIGEGANTWQSYCDTLGISVSSADKLIDRYRTLVLQFGIPVQKLAEIKTLNLQLILPVIKKQPERLEEWLEKAKHLRGIDLIREIVAEKIGDVCLHPEIEVKAYCKICKEFLPDKSQELKKHLHNN